MHRRPWSLVVSATAFALGISPMSLQAQDEGQRDEPAARPQVTPFRAIQRQPQRSSPQRGTPLIRVIPRNDPAPTSAPATSPQNNAPANQGDSSQPGTQQPSGEQPTGTLSAPMRDIFLDGPAPERRVTSGVMARRAVITPGAVRVAPNGTGTGVASITWDDRSRNEQAFIIQRAMLGERNWLPPVEFRVGANQEQFEDRPGMGRFAYRVAAENARGRSWFSDWATVELQPATGEPRQIEGPANNGNGNGNGPALPPTPPAIPADFAVMDAGERRVSLRWTVQAGVTQYGIERSPAFPQGERRFSGSTGEFVDTLSGAMQVRYRIRARGAGGWSAFSEWRNVSVADVVPAAPEGLTALGNDDERRVTLAWNDRSDNETSFVIDRETRSGSGEWAASRSIVTQAGVTQQSDQPGLGEHRYRVRAAGSAGASQPTEWVEVALRAPDVSMPDGAVPDMPLGASVSDAGSGGVVFSWNDGSDGTVSFEIERSPALPQGLVRVSPGVTSWTDSPGPGTFQYRVRAVSGLLASDFTPWSSVTVGQGAPTAPSSLLVDWMGDEGVRLVWRDNSANEALFVVEAQRQTSGGWNATREILVAPNQTEQWDNPGGGLHRYRVASQNAEGARSNATPWVEVTVEVGGDPSADVPASPSAVVAVDQTRRAGVLWADNSGNESGFEIERSPAFGQRVIVGANVSGYVDQTGPGQFSYRVRSFNGAGYSDWSEWASVTVAETSPFPPAQVRAVDQANLRDVQVAWVDQSTNEQGFRVERSEWLENAWGNVTVRLLSSNRVELLDSPGVGRFRYRVQAFNEGGASDWSEFAVVNVTDGWTPVVKSPDTREVFVSSTLGNDSNNGLSEETPVRTLRRAYELLRDRFPDHLRLRRGETWRNERIMNEYGGIDKGGRSAVEPMVLWYYGNDPDRPLIQTGRNYPGMLVMGENARGNLHVIGLHLQANQRIPGDPDFNINDPGGPGIRYYSAHGNLLFEDVVIEGYSGSAFETPSSSEILRNVTIRRSIIIDSYGGMVSEGGNSWVGHSSGLYFSRVDNVLIEESLIDRNGWHPGVPNRPQTIFNHNFYMQPSCTNVMIRNNISSRASATGMQLRGRSQHAFNNLLLANPMHIGAGHAQARWPEEAWTGSIRYNVVLDANDVGRPGDANFGPRGQGIGFSRAIGALVENNIMAHNRSSVGGMSAFSVGVPNNTATVRNNIMYNWTGIPDSPDKGTSFTFEGQLPLGVRIADNMLVQPRGGSLVLSFAQTPGGTLDGNTYFSTSDQNTIWFRLHQAAPLNFPTWVQRTGEVGGETTQPAFPDPERDITTYMASIGRTPTLEAFIQEARQQSRFNWRPEFTAKSVNTYIRAGFGMPEPDDNGTPQQ